MIASVVMFDDSSPVSGSDCDPSTDALAGIADVPATEGVVAATATVFVGATEVVAVVDVVDVGDVVDVVDVDVEVGVVVVVEVVVVVDVVVVVTHPAPPEVITRSPVPLAETATNVLFPKVTEFQLLSVADVRDVHVTPSGLVMTRLPVPLLETATNRPLPYVAENQLLSLAEEQGVHDVPFAEAAVPRSVSDKAKATEIA